MRKHFSKLFGVMTAALMTLTMAAPVSAANYTAVAGGSVTMEKYLVIDSQASIPAAEFNFSIAAGTAVEATADAQKVWAGLNPEAVKIGDAAGEADGKVAFAAGAATTAGTATDGIANDVNKKYAEKDFFVDFSAVSFPEPGVYRYILTEAAVSAPFSGDPVNTRTIDAYVVDNNGSLEVSGYTCYSGTVTTAPPVDGQTGLTKSNKFVNSWDSNDLTFGKTVSGNQASHDQYFAIKVTLAGVGTGDTINVDMSAAETAPIANSATSYTAAVMGEANNITTLTADADGAIEHTFYLKHGQNVTLKGIPAGATYKVEETDPAAGYTKSGEVSTATALSADATVTVNNARTGTIPTGVIMKVLPYGALLGLAVVAIIMNRRKNEAL